MKIQTKVKRFVKFLKNVLIEVEDIDPGIMSDAEILKLFRECLGCGGELITPVQQMHAIIEFNSPARAFEVLCETVEENGGCQNEEECEDEEASCYNPDCINYECEDEPDDYLS